MKHRESEIPKSVLRMARPVPVLGQAAVLASSREILNEKGAIMGGIDIALDLIPIIGRAKGLFEIFAGDVVTEENLRRGFETIRKGLDDVERLLAERRQEIAVQKTENPSAGAEEEARYYPNGSARTARERAKAATRPVYEKRIYHGLA